MAVPTFNDLKRASSLSELLAMLILGTAEDGTAFPSSLSSPDDFQVVTPSNSNALPRMARAFSFAGDGDITLITAAGHTLLIPAGSLAPLVQHACRFSQVKATGTTATGIIAWF